jgi:hypothetical protein
MPRQLNEILNDVLQEKMKQNLFLGAIARRRTTIESISIDPIEGEGLSVILENILVQEMRTTEILDWILIAETNA